MSNKSISVSLCGVMVTLCIVIMMLNTIVTIGQFIFPAIAGILIMCILIELGSKWAWMTFFATAILASIVLPIKEDALLFAIFFGYYPTLRFYIHKIKPKVCRYVIKLMLFNFVAVAEFSIAIFILRVPTDNFTVFGVYLPWILLLCGNIMFFIYDYAIEGLAWKYFMVIHPKVKKLFH